MSQKISRTQRLSRARDALLEAERHLRGGEYVDACIDAKVAVYEYMDGASVSGPRDWERFNSLTPRAQRAHSGIVRTVYTRDAQPTAEDAVFCVEFATQVCAG